MPHQLRLAQHELDFWRALCAPFQDSELSTTSRSGGKSLTYVDKRAIENRLDSVAGPAGWFPEYRATDRGYTCRLSILVPTKDPESWTWLAKEDGAGFEGMVKKQGGEMVEDTDNDEKSGYTNALRRAAQDAFGIGRYLYNKGVPSYFDPNAFRRPSPAAAPVVVAATGTAVESPAPQVQTGPTAPATPKPSPAPEPARPAAPVAPGDGPGPEYFAMPPKGRGVFTWIKRMEDHFQTSLMDGAKREGTEIGAGTMMGQWTQEQVDKILGGIISYLRTQDNYNGELGYEGEGQHSGNAPPLPPKSAPAQSSPAANASPSSPTAQQPASPNGQAASPAVAEARLLCKAAMATYLRDTLGREPGNRDLLSLLADLSPLVKNGFGHEGEEMASVSSCQDDVWLRNLTKYTLEQLKSFRASKANPDVEAVF